MKKFSCLRVSPGMSFSGQVRVCRTDEGDTVSRSAGAHPWGRSLTHAPPSFYTANPATNCDLDKHDYASSGTLPPQIRPSLSL